MKKAMNAMKKMSLVMLTFFGAQVLHLTAQTEQELKTVWVLSEGYSDWDSGEQIEAVSIGVIDPETFLYEEVDVLDGVAFASDVIITEEGVFVAADDQVLRYNRDTYAFELAGDLEGVRKLAYHDGMVYATRGDYDPLTWGGVVFNSYLVWMDAETLEVTGELLAEVGPAYSTEGIEIVEGEVLLAINNGFNGGAEVGLIGRFDPESGAYTEYDLGDTGKNPVHFFEEAGTLYTVNNGDWTMTSLSALSLETGESTTHIVADVAAGCAAAVLSGEELFFQIAGETAVRTAGLSDLESAGTWEGVEAAFYALAKDPVSGRTYGSVTDFATYGEVQIREADGTLLNTVAVGVSPGTIAMDLRQVVNVDAIFADRTFEAVRAVDLLGRSLKLDALGFRIEIGTDGRTRKVYAR